MTDRDRHLRIHDRPYRCDRVNCEFSQIGFSSESRLKVHLKYHQEKTKIHLDQQAEINSHDDMEELLLDAVKADNLAAVGNFISEVPKFAKQLIRQAVQSASCEMLELLLEACDDLQMNPLDVLPWAVKADNFEATQILLDWGASADGGFSYIYHAMKNRSAEMIEVLLQYDLVENPLSTHSIYTITHVIPSRSEPDSDAKAIKCLSLLKNRTTERKPFDDCFIKNANLGCSIAIVRFLLQSGVDVNTRGAVGSADANTALYEASKKRGKSAAELMRFLPESGADPSLRGSRKLIADKPGPRNISKWFGISWEQLVEESAKVYAGSSLPAGSG